MCRFWLGIRIMKWQEGVSCLKGRICSKWSQKNAHLLAFLWVFSLQLRSRESTILTSSTWLIMLVKENLVSPSLDQLRLDINDCMIHKYELPINCENKHKHSSRNSLIYAKLASIFLHGTWFFNMLLFFNNCILWMYFQTYCQLSFCVWCFWLEYV